MAIGPTSGTLPILHRRPDLPRPAEEEFRVAPVPPVEGREPRSGQTAASPASPVETGPFSPGRWGGGDAPLLELQPGEGFRVVDGPSLTATAIDALHSFRETPGVHIEAWPEAIAAYAQAQTLAEPEPVGSRLELWI